MNTNNTIAIMYDFDETLSPQYMQNYDLIPSLGYTPDEFWTMVNELGKKNNSDGILTYLYVSIAEAKKKGIKLTPEKLMEMGKNVPFFEGVETWFDRINKFGAELGLNVEHYIISSGMTDMIRGTKIAKNFKKIFSCTYAYDEEGNPIWPSLAINYTNKTQFIFRVRKNQLDDMHNSYNVNAFLNEEQKLPYRNMIYVGDGMTDIPCMKLIKSKGGHSFSVYDTKSEKCIKVSHTLLNDGRVNFIAPTDYREGSEMDTKMKNLLRYLASQIVQK